MRPVPPQAWLGQKTAVTDFRRLPTTASPSAYRAEGNRTALDLSLPSAGSVFVVFRKPAPDQFVKAINLPDAGALVLGDGTAVIVDRGWVPLETQTPPVGGSAAAPTGKVTVTGLALPPDQVSDPPVDPSPPLVTRIDLVRYWTRLGQK